MEQVRSVVRWQPVAWRLAYPSFTLIRTRTRSTTTTTTRQTKQITHRVMTLLMVTKKQTTGKKKLRLCFALATVLFVREVVTCSRLSSGGVELKEWEERKVKVFVLFQWREAGASAAAFLTCQIWILLLQWLLLLLLFMCVPSWCSWGSNSFRQFEQGQRHCSRLGTPTAAAAATTATTTTTRRAAAAAASAAPSDQT